MKYRLDLPVSRQGLWSPTQTKICLEDLDSKGKNNGGEGGIRTGRPTALDILQMTLRNMLQIATHPRCAFEQLFAGSPEFKTMKPYIPNGLNMKHLGLFMNETFSGRLTEDKIKAIRDKWKGNLVIKGIVNPDDAERAIKLGAKGGDQALQILKRQVQQVMEQVGCEKIEDFPKHLINN